MRLHDHSSENPRQHWTNASNGKISNEVLDTKIHGARGSDGGQYGRAYGCYCGGHDNIYDGNEVYDNQGYAYHIYSSGANDVMNNVVRNNIVHDNGFNANSGSGGIIISSGPNNKVHNNIIYNNAGGIQVDYRCHNCTAYNNTIYENIWAGAAGITIGDSVNNAVIKNNIVYKNAGTIDDQGQNTTVTNNYELDPGFVNASTDFHLKPGSPALTASDTGGEVGAYGNGNSCVGVGCGENGGGNGGGNQNGTQCQPSPNPISGLPSQSINPSQNLPGNPPQNPPVNPPQQGQPGGIGDLLQQLIDLINQILQQIQQLLGGGL
jgi:parallel beta-helix repeat protein